MNEQLRQAIIDGDADLAADLAGQALAAKGGAGVAGDAGAAAAATDLLDVALVPAMEEVAGLWQEGEYFMSDVILSASAFGAAMDVLAPALAAAGDTNRSKVVVGVVAGDLHDLGKDIVVAMLRAGGFAVVDLGIDVSLESFLAAVRDEQPDILGIGAYMSTTMDQIKDIIDALTAAGLREGLKIIVGGVCLNEVLAAQYGADGFGKDAMATVALARSYMEV